MQINPNCRECCGTGIVQPEQGVTFGGDSCTHCDDFPRPALTLNWPKRMYDTPGLQYKEEPPVPEALCRGSIQLGTACRQCSKCMEEMRSLRQEGCPDKTADLELERRALKACGYRVHEKERNGTRWLMAAKGLQVQYKHWHPLTSIHQAMQLLIDCPTRLALDIDAQDVYCTTAEEEKVLAIDHGCSQDAKYLVAAQCRAIVIACASLEPVR